MIKLTRKIGKKERKKEGRKEGKKGGVRERGIQKQKTPRPEILFLFTSR